MKNIYYEKSKILVKHFNMYGYGHFDLTSKEIAKVLELLDKQDKKGLSKFYAELAKKRLG